MKNAVTLLNSQLFFWGGGIRGIRQTKTSLIMYIQGRVPNSPFE